MSLTKVMEIFTNYYAKISFSMQKLLGWHFSILTCSYTRYFPLFLFLGLQKWSQTSPKLIFTLHNIKNEQKYKYGILVSAQDNAQLIGESTSLVCFQLKERDFEKMSLTKVMEIFNNYYAKISFRGMCTVQKILGWHFSILTFSYTRHFPSFLFLGLILVQTAVLAKGNNCVF